MPAPFPALSIQIHKSKYSSKIFRKLLWICYYYSCSLGMVAFRLRRYKPVDSKRNNKIIVNNNIPNSTNIRPYEVYIPKYLLIVHILIRIIFVFAFSCGIFLLWLQDDYVHALLVYTHVACIIICPLMTILVEVLNGEKITQSINCLFHLLSDIEAFNRNYDIFQWTHVGFVFLKVFTFLSEICIVLYTFRDLDSYSLYFLLAVQSVILAEIWLNYHVFTLFYTVLEAMFGSLNNYMRYDLVLRIKDMENIGEDFHVSKEANKMKVDMAKFINLYQKVHRVGIELHRQWQLPLICTLLTVYMGFISNVYYFIWQYIELDIVLLRFIPFLSKILLDIFIISIAAYKVIKSSKLIGCMGLEKAYLIHNIWWHKQIEVFLYYLNMNEFKLNLMGFFDLTNGVTLTFLSGILTAISIFIPFTIKTYRLKIYMEQQN